VTVEGTRDLSGLVQDLKRLGNVEVEDKKAIVCLVGENLRGRIGVAASVFSVLAKNGVNVHMISQGASEINISFVVEEGDVPEAVKRLHAHFFSQKAAVRRESSRKRSPEARALRAAVGSKSLTAVAN